MENKLIIKNELILRIKRLFEQTINPDNMFCDFHLYYDYESSEFFFTEKGSSGVYRFIPSKIEDTLYLFSAWEDDCCWDEDEDDEDSEYFYSNAEHYIESRIYIFTECTIENEIENKESQSFRELFFNDNKESRLIKIDALINQ